MPNDVKDESEIVGLSNVLVSDAGATLEWRWISIPKNVWHRPVIPKGADWLVASFHTVPPDELIEERPGGKRMLYESERKRTASRWMIYSTSALVCNWKRSLMKPQTENKTIFTEIFWKERKVD
jgi:hypothetical protein